MRRCSASEIVLKVLGLLLLTAAVLKGHELLTVPVANKDLWSWRPFLIFQVEFELALGIWLLSGLFKRLAWLAALTCFSLFCCITLYKALTGAASCGCFGRIHVNPWITLTGIDLPAVISLSFFRPAHLLGPLLCRIVLAGGGYWSQSRGQAPTYSGIRSLLKRWAISLRLVITAGFTLVVLGTTTPILALNEPAGITSTYAVLEPETWIGKELPILEYIDIAGQIRSGRWILVFYHHDCPDCQQAMPQYERMAKDLADSQDPVRIALIEVPPYGPNPSGHGSRCLQGRLVPAKEWFITTPITLLAHRARVRAAWETEAPRIETILAAIVRTDGEGKEVRDLVSTLPRIHTSIERR